MLNTTTFKVGEKTYELKLTTRNLIRLEREFHKNPLSIFMQVANNDELPEIEKLLKILYFSLCALHEGEFKSMDDVYNLFDKYVEEGGDSVSLLLVIIEVFQKSGIIPKEDNTEKN